jgi:serine/threonine protein kinase
VDLYAVGIIFHDALVGRPPFTGQLDVVLHQHLHSVPPLLSERSGDSSLPIDLDVLVARLLEKDPAHRPTAAELVVELEQICRQVDNPPPPPPEINLNEQATLKLSVYQRLTSIMPPQERKTSLVDRPNLKTQLIDRQGWPTQLLPQLSGEPSAVSSRSATTETMATIDYERASALLFQKACSLATVAWPGGWPLALLNLRTHIADCDRIEIELSEQLVAIEKHYREHQQVQTRHQQLRQGILTLSERLQTDQSLSDEERQGLFAELEDLERSFFATEQRWRSLPVAAPEPLRHRLDEVQKDRQRARCLFARLVVEMPSPTSAATDRQDLTELLATLESPQKTWARS